MMTAPLLVVITSLWAVGSASAQSSQPPVRLEIRIVAQLGAPPDTVIDVTQPTPLIPYTAGQRQRLEVQYRVIDLDPADEYRPAGLATAMINIVATPASELTVGGAMVERAQLSRFEAQLASSAPPSPEDSSGLPTGAMVTARGLHRPFRGAIAPPAPNNGSPANGAVSGLSINHITPLALVQSDQGNPNGGGDNLGWYGLYSFDFVTGPDTIGPFEISATVINDAVANSRFTVWFDGGIVPPGSTTIWPVISTPTTVWVGQPLQVVSCCLNDGTCRVVASVSNCINTDGSPGDVNGGYCGPQSCCVDPDYNHSGDLSVQDIFDFLAAYFGPQPAAADVNHDGRRSVQDIFDFLAAYFGAEC